MSWSLTRKGKAARNFRIKLPCSSSSSFVIFLFLEKVNLLSMEKYQIDSSGKWKPLLIQRADVAQSGLMQNASLRSKGIIGSSLAGRGSLSQSSSRGISQSTSSDQSWSAQSSVVCLHFSVPFSQPNHPAEGSRDKGEGEKAKTGRFVLIKKSFKSPIEWNWNGWMSRVMSLHLYGYGCGAWAALHTLREFMLLRAEHQA